MLRLIVTTLCMPLLAMLLLGAVLLVGQDNINVRFLVLFSVLHAGITLVVSCTLSALWVGLARYTTLRAVFWVFIGVAWLAYWGQPALLVARSREIHDSGMWHAFAVYQLVIAACALYFWAVGLRRGRSASPAA